MGLLSRASTVGLALDAEGVQDTRRGLEGRPIVERWKVIPAARRHPGPNDLIIPWLQRASNTLKGYAFNGLANIVVRNRLTTCRFTER
jgi:hypothetical protein